MNWLIFILAIFGIIILIAIIIKFVGNKESDSESIWNRIPIIKNWGCKKTISGYRI